MGLVKVADLAKLSYFQIVESSILAALDTLLSFPVAPILSVNADGKKVASMNSNMTR